jgi:tetratricopeptide (TPR) repeat protein
MNRPPHRRSRLARTCSVAAGLAWLGLVALRGAEPGPLDVAKQRFAARDFAGGSTEKAAAELAEIRRRDASQALVLLEEPGLAAKTSEQAFAVVDDLLRREPDNPIAQYHLGRLAALTGQQLDRGEAGLHRYLQHVPAGREPPLCAARWRLGLIREARGDRAGARAEYEAALQLAPDFGPAREALQQLNSR